MGVHLLQFVDGTREDGLEAFRMGCLAPAGLTARIAHEVIGAIFRDILVEVPEMFLALHALDGGPLLFPDGRDVEEYVRLPLHLFRLVRFEEIELRRTENLFAGIVAPGL